MGICLVDGCNNNRYGHGYCIKHYYQIKKHGKILERTRHTLNEIIIENQICRMKLYNRKQEEIAETIFDLKYKDEIEKFKWGLQNGYVKTIWYDENNKLYQIRLHQAIISMSGQIVEMDEEIDHKDGNKLNNLEINLRVCKHFKNMHNIKKHIDNTSGYKGVNYCKNNKKWKAEITVKYKKIYIGVFDDKNDAATKYYGEFAILNEIIT